MLRPVWRKPCGALDIQPVCEKGRGVRGPKATNAEEVMRLFSRQDMVVDRRLILLVKRAGDDVEARRDAACGHCGERQSDIAGGLRVLPLRGVDIAVEHFL